MGVVSQMLKGCTLSGTITPELYNMCHQQADVILGGPEHAKEFMSVRHLLVMPFQYSIRSEGADGCCSHTFASTESSTAYVALRC